MYTSVTESTYIKLTSLIKSLSLDDAVTPETTMFKALLPALIAIRGLITLPSRAILVFTDTLTAVVETEDPTDWNGSDTQPLPRSATDYQEKQNDGEADAGDTSVEGRD